VRSCSADHGVACTVCRKEADVTTTVDIVGVEALDEAQRPDDRDGHQVSPAIRELVSLLAQSYARMPLFP
jgi:hypothetical protein